MVSHPELFFRYLNHNDLNHIFRKHLGPPIQKWTFIKCPFSKTQPISFGENKRKDISSHSY
jgi:hypothetical protein